MSANDGFDTDVQKGRLELKYVVPKYEIFRLNNWLALNWHPIEIAHPPKKIFNAYFDTPNLDCYQENLAGVATRTKLRLRWSNSPELIQDGKLEIKFKRRGLGFKLRQELQKEIDLKTVLWRQILRIIRETTRDNFTFTREVNRYFFPVLINSYDRNYYDVRGTPVRVTVDKKHSVFPQGHSNRINLRNRVLVDESHIVELKFPPSHIDVVSSLVAGLGVLRTRSSKYASGVEAIL